MNTSLYRKYTSEQLEVQAIIYMKGWYIETNAIEDLKKLHGLYCAVDTKFITDLDLFQHFLVPIYNKYVPGKQLNIGDFIRECYKYKWFYTKEEDNKSLTNKDMINTIISEIRSHVMKKDIKDWGKLDSELFPFEEGKDVTWNEQNEVKELQNA